MLKELNAANTDALKNAGIKRVQIKNENDSLLDEIHFNEKGFAVQYKNYSNITYRLTQNIKTQYGARDELNLLNYTYDDKSQNRNIIFTHIGETLIRYEMFFGKELYEACIMHYDDAIEKQRLTGIESNYWNGDSIPMAMNFRYENDKLASVRIPFDTEDILKINYSGDTITIHSEGGYEKFIIKNNVLLKEIIYSSKLNFTGEIDYFYRTEGIIDYSEHTDFLGKKYKHKYEYAVLH